MSSRPRLVPVDDVVAVAAPLRRADIRAAAELADQDRLVPAAVGGRAPARARSAGDGTRSSRRRRCRTASSRPARRRRRRRSDRRRNAARATAAARPRNPLSRSRNAIPVDRRPCRAARCDRGRCHREPRRERCPGVKSECSQPAISVDAAGMARSAGAPRRARCARGGRGSRPAGGRTCAAGSARACRARAPPRRSGPAVGHVCPGEADGVAVQADANRVELAFHLRAASSAARVMLAEQCRCRCRR